MRRLLMGVVSMAMVVSGCGQPSLDPTATSTTAVGSTTTDASATTAPATTDDVMRCEDVGLPTADPSFYADSPKYVGNEMPADEVRQWASQFPGFVDVWIDREHNGWVAAGFTEDVAERQADLEAEFPDDGVVAVEIAWAEAELEELHRRVVAELADVVEIQWSSVEPLYGYVFVNIPVLSDESMSAIHDRFPDERICVEGLDPEDVVPAGPQPQAGDGWRLLVDDKSVGEAYAVGLAWDEDSLLELYEGIPGLGELDVDVDFASEVVIWFGAVYGSSCPNLRLDDVVVEGDTVQAVIVNTDNAFACTDDANPHTYLVALERDRLPAPPFHVSLDQGALTRLLVEADLREPGAIAQPDQVGPDPDPPGREPQGSGIVIETGFPWEYTVDLSCGFETIGEVNDFYWMTSDSIPETWLDAAGPASSVVVELYLHEGPDPTLEVTYEGETVVYQPTDIVGCP